MKVIQKQDDYKYLLKALPQALSVYFNELEIETDSDALFTTARDKLEAFYPLMRCVAHELDLSYDMDISPIEFEDKMLALFDLNFEILHQLDLNKDFDIGDFDYSDGKTAQYLDCFKNYADSLSGEDREKATVWVKLLSSLSKETLIQINANIVIDLFDEIQDSNLAYEIANKIGIEFQETEKISLINEALFQNCRQALSEQKLPESDSIAESIYNDLAETDITALPDLRRLKSVVWNCMSPLNEIVEDTQEEYLKFEKSLYDVLKFDDQIQKIQTKSPTEIKAMIFQQHLRNLHKVDNSNTQVTRLQFDDMKNETKLLSATEDFPIEEQKTAIRLFSQISAETPKWQEYENHHEISDDTRLCNMRKDLLVLTLKQMAAVKYGKDGQISDMSVLIKFNNNLENMIEGNIEMTPHRLNDIWSFSDMLATLSEMSNKYLNTEFDTKIFNHNTINLFSIQNDVRPEDLEVISDSALKFSGTCNEYLLLNTDRRLHLDYISGTKEAIASLPDSPEKTEMQELINIYSVLLFGKVYSAAENQKEKTTKIFGKIHAQEYNNLKRYLSVIAESYPEVTEGIEQTAESINAAAIHNLIVPLYLNKPIKSGSFVLHLGDQALSQEAQQGLLKISSDFMNRVLFKHATLLRRHEIAPETLKALLAQANNDNMLNIFEQNIKKTTAEQQRQIEIYNQYQNYKFMHKTTQPSDELSRRLLIKHKMYRN